MRSKRIRQYTLPGGFSYLSFSPLSGKGKQAESQCHEELDRQSVGIVTTSAEEIPIVTVEFWSPETLRINGTGIVFDLETVGIHPADGKHIAGMQILKGTP